MILSGQKVPPLNRWVLDVAKRRWLKRLMLGALPRIAFVEFPSGECLAIDAHDFRGPSFCLANGWKQPEAALRSYEQEQRSIVEEYLRAKSADGEGLVFLDIGANIGLFMFSAKRRLPRLSIAAFEPHPVSSECISESVRRSGFEGVTVESVALGNVSEHGSLYLDQTDSGGHSLDSSNLWNNTGDTESLRVKIMTLDAWAEARRIQSIDFIKMDVQGGEDDVIQGGLECLARYRPALLIEVQHEKVACDDAVIGSLRKLPFEYSVRSMKGQAGSLEDLKAWSRREFEKGTLFADYLFLPGSGPRAAGT